MTPETIFKKNLKQLNINQIPIYIPRLSENAKHLSLEAVNTEPPDASYFHKIKLIRYKSKAMENNLLTNFRPRKVALSVTFFVCLIAVSVSAWADGVITFLFANILKFRCWWSATLWLMIHPIYTESTWFYAQNNYFRRARDRCVSCENSLRLVAQYDVAFGENS